MTSTEHRVTVELRATRSTQPDQFYGQQNKRPALVGVLRPSIPVPTTADVERAFTDDHPFTVDDCQRAITTQREGIKDAMHRNDLNRARTETIGLLFWLDELATLRRREFARAVAEASDQFKVHNDPELFTSQLDDADHRKNAIRA